MKIIGLTGTTGAGKGEVGHIFASLGAVICDTDAIYHRLLAESESLRRELVDAFGDITDANGNVDRKKLAPIVFADPEKLAALNRITHRYVLEETSRILADAAENGVKVGVIDAPMLFESGADKMCDTVVGVTAPADVRLVRIMARDGISEEAARKRIENQHTDAWFRETCGKIIVNDTDTEALRQNAERVYKEITVNDRKETD